MKVIIAGSRTSTRKEVYDTISRSPFLDQIGVVISGGARGADAYGEEWARENEIDILRFPANWNLYGKSAGFIRNQEMANVADALIAVWDGSSRGTKSMIDIARKMKLLVFVRNQRGGKN